jgi:hypothetical protein
VAAVRGTLVVEYDWERGEVTDSLEPHHLHDVLIRWADDYGADLIRNLM